MADVFLSYSSADRDLTRAIDAELVPPVTPSTGTTCSARREFKTRSSGRSTPRSPSSSSGRPRPSGRTGSTPRPAAAPTDEAGPGQHPRPDDRRPPRAVRRLPLPVPRRHRRDPRRGAQPPRNGVGDRTPGELGPARPAADRHRHPAAAEARGVGPADPATSPAWPTILEQQRRGLSGRLAGARGRELRPAVDAFLVGFATADERRRRALDVQRALAASRLPDDAPVGCGSACTRVAPASRGRLRRSRRLRRRVGSAGAAHGGQVLMSESTARAGRRRPGGLSSWTSASTASRTSPSGSGSSRRCPRPRLDLPADPLPGHAGQPAEAAGPTVGRETEIAELRTLVLDGQRRIVTLTGPGGTGKTRLATALAASVAERFTDGVYLVPLQAATAADHVWTSWPRCSRSLPDGHIPPGFFGYVADRTDARGPGQPRAGAGRRRGGGRPAPGGRSTSRPGDLRRPVHVSGEVDYAVAPLSCLRWAAREEIGRAAAVQLFVEHASRVRKGFKLAPTTPTTSRSSASPRRPAPGDRARRGPGQAAHAQSDPRAHRPEPGSRERRARPGRAAAHHPGRDRLELRPPRAAQQVVLDRLGIFESGASFEAVEGVVPPEHWSMPTWPMSCSSWSTPP